MGIIFFFPRTKIMAIEIYLCYLIMKNLNFHIGWIKVISFLDNFILPWILKSSFLHFQKSLSTDKHLQRALIPDWSHDAGSRNLSAIWFYIIIALACCSIERNTLRLVDCWIILALCHPLQDWARCLSMVMLLLTPLLR